MRIRKKKWALPFLADHPNLVVAAPEKYRGRWQERFAQPAPLNIEIGSGKGAFIVEMARGIPSKTLSESIWKMPCWPWQYAEH